MSFEEARQFTNQMAYQSMFSPPGFSFESPFAYQSSTGLDAQGSTFPTSMNMAMQMPMTMPMAMDVDAEMDLGMGQSSSGSGVGGSQGQAIGSGSSQIDPSQPPGSMTAMWASLAQDSEQGKKDTSMFDMFAAPPAQLSTGDRFSQLLERKLGMSTSIPSVLPSYDPVSNSTQRPCQVGPSPSTYPYASIDPNAYSWDRLAVETNLQDFNQVQIQPDLVAPIPAPYLQYNPTSTMANYNSAASQEYMRTATPYPNGGVNQHGISPVQHQYLSAAPGPYVPYQDGFTNQPMAISAFPVQSPVSMSNRSSPSSNSHQLITPQIASHSMMSDGSWSSSFVPQGHFPSTDAQSRNQQGLAPLSMSGRSHTTGPGFPNDPAYRPHQSYQQAMQMPGSSASAPPSGSERTRLAAMGATLPPPPRAKTIKPVTSHPTLAVGPNGMWSRDMTASTSSQSISSGHSQTTQQYAVPQRSSVQVSPIDQSRLAQPTPLPLPSSLPPAPSVAKRSRSKSSSPHSHPSSSHHSPDQHDNASGSKRPKMSMSVPHPMPHLSSDEHDDGERKVVIACHTCRARKLKCDGARPKCFHCSRRKEDCCSYDVVLRRRGPGRKNKTKQKSEGGSEVSLDDGHRSGGDLGSHGGFAISTERG